MRFLLFVPVLALIGCDRSANTASSPAAAPTGLAVHAEKLGFAQYLPQSTELFLGSTQFREHQKALKSTIYWKTLDLYLQDNKPATQKNAALKSLETLEVEDVFLAVREGGADKMRWITDASKAYNEFTYYTLIAGMTAGLKDGSIGPQTLFANAAGSPDLIYRLCLLMERAELPPFIMGLKTAKPEVILQDIDPPGAPQPFLAGLKKDTYTANGGNFTVYSGPVSTWLTEAKRQEMIASLEKSITDKALITRISEALNKLATKQVSLTLGTLHGYAIVALGSSPAPIEFASAPSESLLARPEFAFAEPHATRDVVALGFAESELLNAVKNEEPTAPILRGAVQGFAGNPIFGPISKKLAPQVDALATLEKKVYQQNLSTVAAIGWWDKGLHLDIAGGLDKTKVILDQPLKLSSLVDMPGTFVTAIGHSPAGTAGRNYFEGWMQLLYTATGAVIQTGVGGDQASGIYAMADQAIIPALVKFYQSSKTLYQQALGSETAFVMDLAGQVPPFPGVMVDAAKPWLPRLAGVHSITNRTLISSSWDQMQAALSEGLQASPTPLPLPAPISSEKNGFTTWFFPLPLGGNDLLPSATLNDSTFIFGSSKDFNEAITAQLQQTRPPLSGAHMKVRFSALRTFIKAAGQSGTPALSGAGPQSALPWIAPFQDLGIHWRLESDQVRTTLDWEIKDTVKYD